MINRSGLRLRRFTIRAEKPIGAAILVHGYAQSAHFEFLRPTYPGGPHSEWDESILQQLVDAGISCYTMDLQGHGESEGARGLRAFFEHFDDLVEDLLQLHDDVARETASSLPLFWVAASMGGAVATRGLQRRPGCAAGLVVLSPMLSLTKVQEQKVFLGVRNRHLVPIASLLSWLVPTLPLIAKKSDPGVAQDHDIEFRSDATNYTGPVRTRVAYLFSTVCRECLLSLEDVGCEALLALHARADSMTDPDGSVALFERARALRKTLVLIGGPGGLPGLCRSQADGVEGPRLEGVAAPKSQQKESRLTAALRALLSLEQWHALTAEDGCEKVSAAVALWIAEEAARFEPWQVVKPKRRQGRSPARR